MFFGYLHIFTLKVNQHYFQIKKKTGTLRIYDDKILNCNPKIQKYSTLVSQISLNNMMHIAYKNEAYFAVGPRFLKFHKIIKYSCMISYGSNSIFSYDIRFS